MKHALLAAAVCMAVLNVVILLWTPWEFWWLSAALDAGTDDLVRSIAEVHGIALDHSKILGTVTMGGHNIAREGNLLMAATGMALLTVVIQFRSLFHRTRGTPG